MSAQPKLTILPYQGPHRLARPSSKPVTFEINMSALSAHEQQTLDERLSPLSDPYTVFTNKVTHLAELLNCTEREAERILLEKL